MNTLWILANRCNNATESVAPIIKERANDYNVLIAAIICISLVLVALIAAITISCWHKKELESRKDSNKANSSEPSLEEKDKREYISKLISFREELSKKDSKLKGTEDAACKEYIELLSALAGLDKQ